MIRRGLLLIACSLLAAVPAVAQLPPDAVQLDKVKIPEKQKSTDLDPVYLIPSTEDGPTWTYEGVEYRGAKADSKEKFMKDPDAYAEKAAKQRWESNFVEAMSTIWCPVTDEITPGGMLQWDKLGVTWESCCKFCDDTVADEDFPRALERLKERAAQSYKLTNGKYVNDASSPVEGAIVLPGAPVAATASAEEERNDRPAYLAGADLEPTYTGGVALVFENRCLECHREGGVAPMSFTTLGGIRQWRKNMKEVLQARTMPPWPASTGVGSFSNSKALTQEELDLLVAWIDAGYAPGEGEYTPTKDWTSEWIIGEPDKTYTIESVTLAEDAASHIKEFTIKTDFPEDRWVVSSEIKPEDTFTVSAVDAGALGSYYPGNTVTEYGEGRGRLLKKGEEIKVRARVIKEAGYEAPMGGIQIAVKFGDAERGVQIARVANDEFTIPAETADHAVTAEATLDEDVSIISLLPNLRERGKTLKVTAVFPDGTEKALLQIPRWNYNWRYRYLLQEPLEAPKGTVIRTEATYDNSKMNANIFAYDSPVKAGAKGESLETFVGYVK